jgi:hypothetical protein
MLFMFSLLISISRPGGFRVFGYGPDGHLLSGEFITPDKSNFRQELLKFAGQ